MYWKYWKNVYIEMQNIENKKKNIYIYIYYILYNILYYYKKYIYILIPNKYRHKYDLFKSTLTFGGYK